MADGTERRVDETKSARSSSDVREAPLDDLLANRRSRRSFLRRGLGTLAGAFAIGPVGAAELLSPPKGGNGRVKLLEVVPVPIPAALRPGVAAAREMLKEQGFEVISDQAMRIRASSPLGIHDTVIYQASSAITGGKQGIIAAALSEVADVETVQAGIVTWSGKAVRALDYYQWHEGRIAHCATLRGHAWNSVDLAVASGSPLSYAELEPLQKSLLIVGERIRRGERSCCSCIINEINESGIACALVTLVLCATLACALCGIFCSVCSFACSFITIYACIPLMSCWDACDICESTGQCGGGGSCDQCCSS